MKYGLSDSAISKIQSVFAKFPAIEKTVLYGSRAKGNYKPGSDIDLTLFGDELTDKILGDVFFELDDLLLPYMIDLSIFEHIDNVNLREHIERVGVIFYEKMSESGWPGWKDKKDEDKSRNILKSSNPVNPDSDSGWEVKKLGDLSKRKDAVVSGPFGSNLKVSDYKLEGVPILRLQNIGKGFFIDKSIKYITEKKADELKYHSFLPGDIALAKLGIPIGKTCVIPNNFKEGIITADIVRIRPDTHIVDYNFLQYFLNTDLSVSQLTGNISGATRPRVNLSDVRNIKIPLPPLPEQKQIVAILDKAFAAIAQAKANAEQNLKNAKELFESYLEGMLLNRGEGWEEVKFEEVCNLTRGHNPPKSKFISEPREGYVRFYQIRDGWAENYAVYVPDTPQLHKVYPNEVLMVAYRHIGKVFRGVSGAFNVALCKISNKDTRKLDDDYLFYIIPTDIVKGELMKRSERSLIPSMSVKHLKEILIPLPPIKTQQSIVQKLDTLSAQTKKLESLYQQKIDALEELKKSLLQRAFSGQLSESGFTGLEDLRISRDLSSSCPSSHPGHPDSDRWRQ